jgi:hypothetical protein
MYKKTDPQQSLFGVETQLNASLRVRLQGSWAQLFRAEILSILLKSEDKFSMLYGKTGRPNFSVARMLGLCLLQELNSLSDQQALDAYGFDIRWRYALDVNDDDAYLSRRSLVEFRRRLAVKDPQMAIMRSLFEGISKSAIKKLGLSTSEQRADSTHIVSNICTRGRLDLFAKTMSHFIKNLDEKRFSSIPDNIKRWHQRDPEGWFGLGLVQRTAKLEQLARYVNKLIIIFKNDQQVITAEPYQLLVRLFKEQCEVVDKSDSDKGSGTGKRIKIKRKSKGQTLQSPFDPDASYGHKGQGYSAQITETCNNKDKCEIITDYEVNTAARSDKGKASDIVNRLASADLKPDTLYADGGYPSAPSALEVVEKDVEFIAPVDRARLPEEVMGRNRFEFDQDGFLVQCPQGHKPVDHRMRSSNNQKGSALHAIFNGDICRACSKLRLCPVRGPNNRQRGSDLRNSKGQFRLEITAKLRLRDQMYADQQTDAWKKRYKIRSGIEATMSELKRSHGMGKMRVRRAAKVSFAVVCKVIACNIKRWAKAYDGSSYVLQCIFCFILDFMRPIEAIFKEQCQRSNENRTLAIV